MTNTASSVANPFIGPRSFETGERLFGRDREVRDLLHLLIAERIVLLYSPSGAGKSSLIKAALIPALEKKDFVALPPIRVNQELPQDAPPGANRYVYSTLLSLEERLASAERLPLGTLATFTLATYLQQRLLPPIRAADHDPVLLFDQFEEVLTADPTNVDAKHAFFAQLGEALGDRQLWALFAMREDYVTALDPYLVPVPNRFNDTFRLDLLGVDAARQAMQGPAKAAGVTFSTEAAVRLADDLRRTRVQCADGSSQEVLGPHVEPVQLQVVCLRLWERRFPPGTPEHELTITPDDITDVGDVDSALAGYYTDRVRAVAAATGVKERAIRDWVDGELITPQGQRGQVMREAGSSAGLDNHAIMGLIDAHLVRGDERHGTLWFELAHDRLVAPIQQNNAAWRLATLTPFQRQALLWEEQGRGEGLLLQGAELIEGEQWAEAHAADLTEEERAFLDACRKARAIREQQERANRRIRQALVGAVIAALIAIGLASFAYSQKREADVQRQSAQQQSKRAEQQSKRAEQQARNAELRALVAQSLDAQDKAPQRSLLLAIAAQQTGAAEPLRLSVGLNALIQELQRTGGYPLHSYDPLRGRKQSIKALAFSPDGRTLATASSDATVHLWRADAPSVPPIVLQDSEGITNINAMTFSPNARFLAITDGAAVRLWHINAPSVPPSALSGPESIIDALAFSPDEHTLAAGNKSGTILLWHVDTPSLPPSELQGPEDPITALAFSPDGRFLATCYVNGLVRLWHTDATSSSPIVLDGHIGSIERLAFSPDGRFLATANSGNTGQLWLVGTPDYPPIVFQGSIRTLAFSPDGHTLATGGDDNTARLWRVDVLPLSPPIVLRGHEGVIQALAFSPNGHTLATGSDDATARLWQIDTLNSASTLLSRQENWIMSLAFSPDGRTLATINMDNVAHLWRVDEPFSPSSVLQGREDPVSTLDFDTDGYSLVTNFSPDGHTLAHIDEHTVRLWRMEVPNTPPSELTDQEASMSASAFSPDSRFLATGNVSGTVSIWRVDAPSSAPVILRNHEGPITTLAFSPDGRMLASGDRDGTIRLWRLNTPTSPPIVLNAQTYIYALTFSPDGHLLASGSNDPTIRLWHVDAPSSPPIVLPGHEEHIDRLVFSPDGRLLASGGSDKTARLWHVDAPSSPPIVLPGLEGDIDRLAFSPDGRMLATTSSEGAVLIWHVDTPSTLPLIITEQGEVITTLAFSPDGRTLASGDRMGNLRLWHLDGSELVQAACTTAGRNFSLIEWQQLYDTATPYHKTCLWLPHHPNIYQNLLAHGQFDLALMAYQEDYSLASMNAEVTPWLTSQAATENEKDVVQSLLLYLLARWHDPKLRDALPADLGTLCQLGAEKLPTPPFLDACDRALTINPDDLTATYARGRLRTRLGDDAGALSDLQTAQRLAQEQHQDDMLEGIQRWTDDLKAGRDPLAPAPTPAAP